MQITTEITVQDALRLGVEPGDRTYEIDVAALSAEQRRDIAAELDGDTTRVWYLGSYLQADTLAGVVDAIVAKRARERERKREAQARAEAALAQWLRDGADINKAWVDVSADAVMVRVYGGPSISLPVTGLDADRIRQQIAERCEQAHEREIARERAEADREQVRVEAAAAYDAERAQWISEHGSKRLRICLAEDIECDAAYRDERLAVERPGWQWMADVDGDDDDARNPPVDALDILDVARQTAPDAVLRYWERDGSIDPDTGEETDEWRGYVALAEYLGRQIVLMP